MAILQGISSEGPYLSGTASRLRGPGTAGVAGSLCALFPVAWMDGPRGWLHLESAFVCTHCSSLKQHELLVQSRVEGELSIKERSTSPGPPLAEPAE